MAESTKIPVSKVSRIKRWLFYLVLAIAMLFGLSWVGLDWLHGGLGP
ncbi:MAG: hypothetical protein V1907_03340 [Candidatus Kerfeldbacteria bacterium]